MIQYLSATLHNCIALHFRLAMAPQQQDVILSDLVDTPSNLKVITKALELPVVSDTVTAASVLVDPYLAASKPYLETFVKHGGPVLENLYSKAEGVVTEETKTKISGVSQDIKVKMTSTMESLDSLACQGLEKITEKVPNLKDPKCVEKTKVMYDRSSILTPTPQDSLLTHFHLTIEYLASFTVSQVGLQLGEGALWLVQVCWLHLPLLLLSLLFLTALCT